MTRPQYISAQSIKQYIYEHECIEDVLDALECQNIHKEQNGKIFAAQLPDKFGSHNKRAVQIRNDEGLYSNIRNRGITGDIFQIIGYIKFEYVTSEQVKKNFKKITQWIVELLGLEGQEIQSKPKVVSTNKWLDEIKKTRTKQVQVVENIPIDESVLNDYIQLPHVKWLSEGIKYGTQVEFEVGFDIMTNRITLPIRDSQGRLVGVKARYVGDNQEILDERKYLYLIECNKSLLLFNLHRALPHIQEQKEVIIFESEKSVLLAWQYGFKNSVAIAGDTISSVQIQLLKNLGIDVVWVFAYDKDKKDDWIKMQLKKITNRKVYYIYDDVGELGEKDSIVDNGREVCYNLYTRCRRSYVR